MRGAPRRRGRHHPGHHGHRPRRRRRDRRRRATAHRPLTRTFPCIRGTTGAAGPNGEPPVTTTPTASTAETTDAVREAMRSALLAQGFAPADVEATLPAQEE